MGSFSNVLGAIDSQAPDTPSTRLTVRPQSAFSGVLDAIDKGGDTGATQESSKPTRNIGTAEAFGRGAASGVTANFYDELRGFTEANGIDENQAGRLHDTVLGAIKYFAGNPEAVKRYEAAVTRERGLNQQAEEQHPVASTVGNVAGSLVLPVGGAAGGATLAARTGRGALIGAGYGALSGAGEGDGAADRATRATTGGLIGGTLGAAAPAVVEGAIQGARIATSPVTSTIRGAINPENEAGRRVVGAIERDMRLDPNANNRLSPSEFVANSQNGGPATVMDTGGETTRALARSAANTSPEGRAVLNDAINQRFEGQSGRVGDWLRSNFNYPNAQAQQEAIDQTAKTVNRARYAKAYQEGDKQIMSSGMDQLMGSPAVVSAMQRASQSGKDRAITQGLGAMRQGATVENGVVSFPKGPNGVPTYPNLQFWDATKRELDDAAQAAARSGRTGEASVIGDLSKKLRSELDAQVPSYANARQGAAHFFGASDALEAGQNFVTAKMENGQARAAVAKMSPTEKQLFQDGFVSQLVSHLNETGDRRSILNKISDSPAARERLHIALGPQKANELEANMRVEGIMDLARKAVQGNSTTARQLVELGLAGGAAGTGGVGAYNLDPKQMTYAAIAGAFIGGKHHVDVRLAQRVAEMLVSKDPKVLLRGAQVVAKDAKMLNNMRAFDRRVAALGGERSPNGLIAGGVVPSHADDNQPSQ